MLKLFLTGLVTFLGCVTAIMGFNYVNDPFQYYRVHDAGKVYFSSYDRFIVPGLIRRADFDTILIGTSRSQNFTPSMFADAGWRLTKLTLAGARSREMRKVATNGIASGKLKRVVWELSSNSFRGGPGDVHQAIAFPQYLYDVNLETPFSYLLSIDLAEKSLALVQGKAYGRPTASMGVWMPYHAEKFGQNLYIDHTLDCRSAVRFSLPTPALPAPLDAAVERNLADIVSANPGVQFIAYLPPFPTVAYARRNMADYVSSELGFRKKIYALRDRLPNFRLYDFGLMREVTTDPKRYKDYDHYDQAANAEMARIMTSGEWFAEKLSFEESTALLGKHIRETDWLSLAECRRQLQDETSSIQPLANADRLRRRSAQ